MNDIDRPKCGHCGNPVLGWGVADDTPLCHTGTIPPDGEPQDCYRLCTVYGSRHKVHGACCSEDFDGCSRRSCRDKGKHSLKWGECEYAPEPARPEPEFGFWHTRITEDDHSSIYQATIPLAAVLPWTGRLTVGERWQMLEEAANADDPAQCLSGWQSAALEREDEHSFTIESGPVDPSMVAMVTSVTNHVSGVEVRAQFEEDEPAHVYLSTACWHDVHTRCRSECKFGGEACVCECHGERPAYADADLRAALIAAMLPVIADPAWGFSSSHGRNADTLADAVLEALRSRPAKG